ncbi:MAG: carbohydrate ABC transporter permease [Cypionkella sp.]
MSARLLPYALILPVRLFLCVFFLYPFVLIAQQGFSTGNGFALDNFHAVTGYWKFPISLTNTLMLAALVVPIQLALSLLMATMVTKMQKGRDLVLYIWTIPLGISDLAAGLIWLAIFDQSGYLNSMMSGFGLIYKPVSLLTYRIPASSFWRLPWRRSSVSPPSCW